MIDTKGMRPIEYIIGALKTEPPPHKMSVPKSKVRLLHAAMGLCTESGELMDQLKRNIFYNAELDGVNLVEEAGDILWYLAVLLDELETSFEEVMAVNNAKLKKRFPDKFSIEKAIDRDLDAEREVLEKELK